MFLFNNMDSFLHEAAAYIVTKSYIQRCHTESQLVSKGQVAKKVRAAPLGSSLPSC